MKKPKPKTKKLKKRFTLTLDPAIVKKAAKVLKGQNPKNNLSKFTNNNLKILIENEK